MTGRSHKNRRIAELAERCADSGRPLTMQRRAVLECLLDRRDHPTADALHAIVAEAYPSLSRATVYRSLETLVELGCIARVNHPGVAVRYDPKTQRHHHLICDACGSIEDVEDADSEMPSLKIPKGFEVRDFSVNLLGRCKSCR